MGIRLQTTAYFDVTPRQERHLREKGVELVYPETFGGSVYGDHGLKCTSCGTTWMPEMNTSRIKVDAQGGWDWLLRHGTLSCPKGCKSQPKKPKPASWD